MTRSDSDTSQQHLQQTREDGDEMRGVREGTSTSSIGNNNIDGLHQMQSRTPTPHSSAGSSSQQPEKPTLPPASTLTQHADAQESQQVAQRSRWQAMILEAGGISAALSDESMRRLKYCLQWLQVRHHARISYFRSLVRCLRSLTDDGLS